MTTIGHGKNTLMGWLRSWSLGQFHTSPIDRSCPSWQRVGRWLRSVRRRTPTQTRARLETMPAQRARASALPQ